jgi:hypothetical protein
LDETSVGAQTGLKGSTARYCTNKTRFIAANAVTKLNSVKPIRRLMVARRALSFAVIHTCISAGRSFTTELCPIYFIAEVISDLIVSPLDPKFWDGATSWG